MAAEKRRTFETAGTGAITIEQFQDGIKELNILDGKAEQVIAEQIKKEYEDNNRR